MARPVSLDPKLKSLIGSLRSAIRKYVFWDSALAMLLVLLSAFWIGLALDWLPVKLGGTEMPRSARGVLVALASAGIFYVVFRLLVGRLWRSLPDDSLALLVERHHPGLGGRLVTAVQLTAQGRQGDSHDPHLLEQVHEQATAAISDVQPSRVFRWEPIIRKGLVASPMVLGVLILLIASPQTLATAASRLTLWSDTPWPRQAHLEMVGVELPVIRAREDESLDPQLVVFDDQSKTVRLPKGSDGTLRIRAKANDGAVVPDTCTAYYQTESGVRGQANLRRVGREIDGYQAFLLDGPPLTGLYESMMISVRGLDDRLDDYEIIAVEPPAITQLQVQVRYPEYLRSGLPKDQAINDLTTNYQAGLRVREGSRVTLLAESSVPLESVDYVIEQNGVLDQETQPELIQENRSVRIQLKDFTAAATVRLVPVDAEGISAQSPFRYFINVVRDQPPQVKLKLDGVGSAITPSARLPLQLSAVDDYGITDCSVQLAVSQNDSANTPTPEADENSEAITDEEQLPSKLAALNPSLDRDGSADAEIDLRQLVNEKKVRQTKPGDVVQVFAEALDGFDLQGQHIVRSELYRLQVVTPEQLLALLERRELGLRSRLEQTIDETRGLRDALARLDTSIEATESGPPSTKSGDPDVESVPPQGNSPEIEAERALQIARLRVQQSSLQASKTADELSGIVAGLEDLLEEMVNNRVDSIDRLERIGNEVRNPLQAVLDEELEALKEQIDKLASSLGDPTEAQGNRARCVETADETLLKLTAVLEKMLDLESYNEILDLVRGLIEDQDKLKAETEEQRKERIKSFFDDF